MVMGSGGSAFGQGAAAAHFIYLESRLEALCIQIEFAFAKFSLVSRILTQRGIKMGTKIRKFMNKESTCGFVFALPFTIGFLLFLLVPMLISLYYSFCDYNILTPAKFTGVSNYIKMFTGDETFLHSLKATFYFAFVSVPLKLVFALIVAMILEKNSKMSGFYRAAYYLPSIIGGSVAVAVLWKRMFAVDGTVNSLLQMVGIDCHRAWLGDTKTAIWVLIILTVWQFGSSMLVFLSALKQIPGFFEADSGGSV